MDRLLCSIGLVCYPASKSFEGFVKKLSIPTSILIMVVVSACAGPNPNIGERTADMAWFNGHYARAIEVIKPHAEAGEPWAQLRLGIMYENGWGTEQSTLKAIEWYKKVAAQKAQGGWAEGQMIGALGRPGYFNQNGDARIAQRNLAYIYLHGAGVEKDLMRAYLNIRAVSEETQGRSIFFCCEFAGGRVFSAKDIADIYQAVLKEMPPEQKVEAEEKFLAQKDK